MKKTLHFFTYFIIIFDIATSFDADGHSAIGMTTISGLQHNFSQKLKRLMNGKDIVDISGWGERVSQKHPSTFPFHFQAQKRSNYVFNKDGTVINSQKLNDERSSLKVDDSCKKNGHCLVPMIKHLYYRLIGDQESSKMEYPKGIQLTESDSVKFLINLVGDLHQPLHFGFEEDNLGRNIYGVMNINGTDEKISLYDIWENGITRKLKIERPQFWFGGWTHILAIRDSYDKEIQRWKEKGIDIVDEWASESFNIMCNTIYSHPISKQPLNNNFNVDLTLEFAWFEIFRNRILIAGARLSVILNEVLKQREGREKPFRTTNSLLLSSEEDVNHRISDPNIGSTTIKKSSYSELHIFGKKIKLSIWIKNLLINLIIILICLTLFFYISIFRLKDTHSIAKHSQLPTTEHNTKNIQMKGTSMID